MKGFAVRTIAHEFTTAADGSYSGTIDAPPVTGWLDAVRIPNAGTAWAPGGTADVTLTRAVDGGTLLALTNLTAPLDVSPRPNTTTLTGAAGTANSVRGPAVNGGIVATVAQGAASAAGTLYLHIAQ